MRVKLVVPNALEPVAIRLTKTELRPGTADNDVNAILSTSGGLPDGCIGLGIPHQQLCVVPADQHGRSAHLERVPFETDMQVDFTTDNLLVKGCMSATASATTTGVRFGQLPDRVSGRGAYLLN